MWRAYRHGLNVTKLHCYIVTWHIVTPSPESGEKQSSRHDFYGFEASKFLRPFGSKRDKLERRFVSRLRLSECRAMLA